MKNTKIFLFFLLIITLLFTFFYLPVKQAFLFTEMNTKNNSLFYISLKEQKGFQIRYVHSIHLTDVIEFYEVTPNNKIRMLSMTYESLSIGLPGEAGEGETLDLTDGVYTLTYADRVVDSFRMRIGQVDADLAFRYGGNEIDLKEDLEKGESYEFEVVKLTLYQLMKGVDLHG